MLNLYTISTKRENTEEKFSGQEKLSILYHDIFDYPLSFSDLIRWKSEKQLSIINYQFSITRRRGFYFLEGREGLIYKRLLRKRISAKKLKIAQSASRILEFVPGVKMVAVTGSLAMENSAEESDIDLMIVTKKSMLWTTRLLCYFSLFTFHFSLRSPEDKRQKDKLCLNMWLDESDLTWKKSDRNLYTAHEIAQIVSLVNKDKTYEKFLFKNKWILSFWPNSVRILNFESGISKEMKTRFYILDSIFLVIEKICHWVQIQYMRPKMTREVAGVTRALFHPQDWGKVVMSRLSS